MHLEGSHTFQATPARLWELLNDPQVLTRTTPGLKSLETLEEDHYQAHFQIKMGPVNSSFAGTLSVRDKQPPASYRLVIEVDGPVGSARAEGAFDIRDEGDAAVVAFAGDARISGVLARIGGRVLTGVARKFTNQFFEALEREL